MTVQAGPERQIAVLAAGSAPLPEGMVNESFSSSPIADRDGLTRIIRELMDSLKTPAARHAGLSLPDSLFRVQAFEFDSLPAGAADRERLIRWRFEKSAVFDTGDTVLRYQVVRQGKEGAVLVASIAKRETIRQYEDLLLGLGLAPWMIAPSSFHIMNFYAPLLRANGAGFAMAVVRGNAFVTLGMDRGGPRFYRFKEVKAGGPGDIRDRLAREIEDSLHFYAHRDRAQQAELGRLYLAGDEPDAAELTRRLQACLPFPVAVLSPGSVSAHRDAGGWPVSTAAALGAGRGSA